jgi:hypothetical protein
MVRHARVGLLTVLLSITSICCSMQLTVPYFAKAPTLDGRVSPEEQAGAAKITITLVGGLDKPRYPTTAYFFVNNDGMYVGFTCEEPDVKGIVTNAQKENGAVFEDDSVQLFLSPDREATKTNYYHFAVNSAGIKYSNNMQDDEPLQGWQAVAGRATKSWDAEIFIPFQTIKGQTDVPYWRMNVARQRAERGREMAETSAWINPGASLHNYKRFGFLQFKLPTQAPAVSPAAMVSAPAATTATVTAVSAISTPAAIATLSTSTVATTTAVFAAPR